MAATDIPHIITTPRLIIKPPTIADTADIHAAKTAMWPDLQRWMSWATPENAELESTNRWAATSQYQNAYGIYDIPMIARTRDTGQFVVSGGVHPSKPGAYPDYPTYSTGYWVAKDAQNKGLATEATNAIIRYAFDVLKVPSISIQHYSGNEPSKRVIEKLGFTYLRTHIDAHRSFYDGTVLDELHYVMESPTVLPALDVTFS